MSCVSEVTAEVPMRKREDRAAWNGVRDLSGSMKEESGEKNRQEMAPSVGQLAELNFSHKALSKEGVRHSARWEGAEDACAPHGSFSFSVQE